MAAYPVISKGTKTGFHCYLNGATGIPTLEAGLRRGVHFPLMKAVDNLGVTLEARQKDPGILTIHRFVNILADSCDNIPFYEGGQLRWASKPLATWTRVEMQVFAQVVIKSILTRMNAEERAAVNWFEPINEADPPGVAGWRAFGLVMIELMREADKWGLKLALPAFCAGTPEWDELNALVETGVFGMMKAGGHILTIHEGVFGINDPIAFGTIPGAPFVPGTGPTCFRYRYLYYLLEKRNEVVPLVISEYVYGGGYSEGNIEDVMARVILVDTEVRKDWYVLAVLPYTIGQTWNGQQYGFIYPRLLDYAERIKDYTNGGVPVTTQPGARVIINCQALNVRAFPWIGAEPPKVALLHAGDKVTQYGNLFSLPGMLYGWACISPNGDKWVSARYLGVPA